MQGFWTIWISGLGAFKVLGFGVQGHFDLGSYQEGAPMRALTEISAAPLCKQTTK